jgi:hypothetical protein
MTNDDRSGEVDFFFHLLHYDESSADIVGLQLVYGRVQDGDEDCDNCQLN